MIVPVAASKLLVKLGMARLASTSLPKNTPDSTAVLRTFAPPLRPGDVDSITVGLSWKTRISMRDAQSKTFL